MEHDLRVNELEGVCMAFVVVLILVLMEYGLRVVKIFGRFGYL